MKRTIIALVLTALSLTACGGNIVKSEDLKPQPKSGDKEFSAAAPSGLLVVPTTVPEDTYLKSVSTFTAKDVVGPASPQSKSLRYAMAGVTWAISVCASKPADFKDMCAASTDEKPAVGSVDGIQYAVWNDVHSDQPTPAWASHMTTSWKQLSWVPRMKEGVIPPGVQ